jgi:hypothetical protein
MDEGSDGLFTGIILTFIWRNYGKSPNISNSISNDMHEIQTVQLPMQKVL